MSEYNVNEASFDLHPSLKDRSVNQFIINDNGPSDFSFVISRAEDFTEKTVDAFADRLASELRKVLPKFELLDKHERRIDSLPAVQLHYTWRSGESDMHQRQVAVFVRGANANQSKALILTATSYGVIKDEWHHAFEHMLGSMRLHAPLPPAAAPAQET